MVLSAVAWVGAAGGDWNTPANWSTGNVPLADDDVTIDTAAAMSISISPGDTITVNRLTTGANDTLAITGGSLTVTAGSVLSGPLTVTGGSLTASGGNADLTANASTTVSGASLFAAAGGALNLPQLTAYTSGSNSTLEATGAKSVLNLAALATLSADGYLGISASDGGEINLGDLTRLTGNAQADNLRLADLAGGSIVAPDLTSLDSVLATIDGTDHNGASAWNSFTNGSLTIIGGTYDLPQLLDLHGTNLNLSGGASLTLSDMTIDRFSVVNLSGGAKLTTTGNFVNNGLLTVNAASKLAVGGNFTQAGRAALNVQVAGSSAGGQFGRVAVQYQATLDGTLNVALANGYNPQYGDDFRVLTFGTRSGSFTPGAGLGSSLVESIGPTSIDLSPPPDTIESPSGATLSTAIGTGFYDLVATFVDNNTNAQASQFAALVDWGDGTTNQANVSTSGNLFQVYGYHDYAHAGTFNVTTTVVGRGTTTTIAGAAVVAPTENSKIVVTTTADTDAVNAANSPVDANGNISLRSAIEYVSATSQTGDTVAFDGNYVRGPVELTLGPLEIDESMTIDGGGVNQLTIGQETADSGPMIKINKQDASNTPVAVTISNLTLNLGTLAANNSAAIENLGSLSLKNVNFAASIASAPTPGSTVALVIGGGQLIGLAEINGTTGNSSDDVGVNRGTDVFSFKANYVPGGLNLAFDPSPVLSVSNPTASGGDVTVTQSTPVPAKDIVADWRFQDAPAGQAASGTIADSSGNGLNGTPIGSPVYSSNVPYSTVPQTGAPDSVSLAFNGTNQQVFVPDSPALELTHSLTIEAEVYLTAAPTNYNSEIVFRGDNQHDPYSLGINGSGSNVSATFSIGNVNGGAEILAPLPGLNQWIDIAATLDDATGIMRLYVNGQMERSSNISVRPFGALDPSADAGLGIGNMQSASAHVYFQGLINEVRIYDVALTQGQFLSSTPGNLVVTNGGNVLLNEPVSDLTALSLDDMSGGSTFDVTPNAAVPININGSQPGGTLILPQSGTLKQAYDPSGGYSGTWSNAGLQPVTFSGIQTLEQKLYVLPTSSVTALPALSPASFSMSWTGSDAGGPGIAGYNVFVSDNGGPFTLWQSDVTQTSATWQGTPGHDYGFFSVAIDAFGLAQATPTAAQATTAAILGEPNANYVTAVYHDVLGRAPDDAGLIYWVHLLDQGASIGGVAVAIAHSSEYYINFVIKPDFQRLLGRAPDDPEITNWVAKMQAGLTDQGLEAELLASSEFFQNAGGTNADWINAVYKFLLGRAADASGESFWLNRLSAGATRLTVAQEFAGSGENDTQLVKDDYFHYLGRAADSAGLTFWILQLAGGETNEDIIAGFTGSAEYFAEHANSG